MRQQINDAPLSEAANGLAESCAVIGLFDSLCNISDGALSVHCLKYSEFSLINGEMWPAEDYDA